MTFQEKLRDLMMQYNVTQKKVSEDTGIAFGTIVAYANGLRNPKELNARILAKYFGVSYDYLTNPDINAQTMRIPVLGDVAGGAPIDAVQYIEGYEEISEALAKTGTFFGLKIRGTSMEPIIHNGDTVIVRQQPSIESGQCAVIYMDDYKATCKLVYFTCDGGIRLEAYNTDVYNPKTFTSKELEEQNFKILGKVIKSVHNF